MKAGNKQGMLGTLAVRSRWGCLRGHAGRAQREHVGKQMTFLWGRSHNLLPSPAAGPELSSGEAGTSKVGPGLGRNRALSRRLLVGPRHLIKWSALSLPRTWTQGLQGSRQPDSVSLLTTNWSQSLGGAGPSAGGAADPQLDPCRTKWGLGGGPSEQDTHK